MPRPERQSAAGGRTAGGKPKSKAKAKAKANSVSSKSSSPKAVAAVLNSKDEGAALMAKIVPLKTLNDVKGLESELKEVAQAEQHTIHHMHSFRKCDLDFKNNPMAPELLASIAMW